MFEIIECEQEKLRKGLRPISVSASPKALEFFESHWNNLIMNVYGPKDVNIMKLCNILVNKAEHLLSGFIVHYSDGNMIHHTPEIHIPKI